MTDVLDKAFVLVKNREANSDIIAELACQLEQSSVRSRQLAHENRMLRDSRNTNKKWMNRLIKYYKAHRDELLNDRQNNQPR